VANEFHRARSLVSARTIKVRTIAVATPKGGAGKTTLAVHLAIAGYLRGHRVILADADPQRSASDVLRMRVGPGPKRVETAGPKLFALKDSAERAGADFLIIDTPAGPEQDVGPALTHADLTVLVVRPTFLDIASAVRIIDLTRRLGRSAVIVLNQALCPRASLEPPSVQTSLQALRFTGLPVSPVVIRSRAAYQTAVASGKSAEEFGPSPAADETAALWLYLERLVGEEAVRRRA
jgi:chromosome partitioning protein